MFSMWHYVYHLILHREWIDHHLILSAVKACLTSLGACPSASQLVACTMTSLPYKPYTSHGKKLHSRSFEVASSSKCRPEFLCSWFYSNSSEKLKLAIDVDNQLDGIGLLLSLRSYMQKIMPWTTPKIEFSVNKISVQ